MTSTTTKTAICAVCGEPFDPTVRFALVSRYCSQACRNEGNKQTIMPGRRGETAAIVPSERTPIRKEPMTEDEFDWWMTHFRRKLNEDAYYPSDLHWRRTEIQRKVADGWTVGQLARYFQTTREQMRELVQAGKREERAA